MTYELLLDIAGRMGVEGLRRRIEIRRAIEILNAASKGE